MWEEGNINGLLEERRTKKKGRLPSNTKPMIIEKILSKSKQLMGKGNVNGALQLLRNNMSNGTLPLSNDALLVLHVKYPEQQEVHNEVLLQDSVHSIVYDDIEKSIGNESGHKIKRWLWSIRA